jgi:hypothetical protein
MTIQQYALSIFKLSGELIHISDHEGNVLLINEVQPGWGGFGNNEASNEIFIDGKAAEFISDDDRSKSVGSRRFQWK